MDRVAWVIGGGSGIGRAAAIAAHQSGARVAVSGRREDAVAETVRLIDATAPGQDAADHRPAIALPFDATDPAALASAHTRIVAELGPVTELIVAAGLNAPNRTWANQSMADFEAIVATNLTAVARAIDAVLPGMRDAGGGTVVVVSSYAGWTPTENSGVAYSASKTALGSLCLQLNRQEGSRGIRATHLCPGDVDSDFLAMRPEVPDAAARERMLRPEDVARAVRFVLESPKHVRIDELVITPTGRA
jgi:NADP-dependent 3-hydroxy acid dehydrogenase YdfG